MPGGAIVAAALNTAAAHPFGLYVDGVDLLPQTSGGMPAVPYDSISAPLNPEQNDSLTFEVWDPARSFALAGGEPVLYMDVVNNNPLFGGFVSKTSRRPAFATGRIWNVTCQSNDTLLDQRIVPGDAMPAGLTDQVLIQHLVAAWGGPIRGMSSTVAVTSGPNTAIAWAPMTLRQAIRQVGDAAGDGRVAWVDEFLNLNYTLTSVLVAPYAIVDTTPGAGQVAARSISLDVDAETDYDEVYVVGANAAGSGWVRGQRVRAIARQAMLQNTDSDTAAKRNRYGAAYLANSGVTLTSGRLTVEGVDGWLPGQIITITNTGLGLSSAQYLIRTVEPVVETGAGRKAYAISFGDIPRSLRRLLRDKLRQHQGAPRWT